MTGLAGYLLRSALSLLVLYIFYVLFLSREKIHRFNRFYLLSSLIFSLSVPLITISSFSGSSGLTGQVNFNHLQSEYLKFEILYSSEANSGLQMVLIIYFAGLLISTLRFLYNLFNLLARKRRCPSVYVDDHRVILVRELALPYSFLADVYVNEEEFRLGRVPKELLLHEFAHLEQHHSIDIILVELLKTIFWFNPIFIFYKQAIMLNHEYLADDAVVYSHEGIVSYSEVLFTMVFRKNNEYLASSFNYSLTKKRLLMLTKKNFPMTAMIKKLAVIPLFMVLGLFVLNAQDPPPPPPPPPPPSLADDEWWLPVVEKYNLKPDPSKSYYTGTLFETGDEFSVNDSLITMKNAFIVSKTEGDYIRVIRAVSATHNLKTNNFTCKGANGELYKASKFENPEKVENYNNFGFRLSDEGVSAPPPPPPPPPPSNE